MIWAEGQADYEARREAQALRSRVVELEDRLEKMEAAFEARVEKLKRFEEKERAT